MIFWSLIWQHRYRLAHEWKIRKQNNKKIAGWKMLAVRSPSLKVRTLAFQARNAGFKSRGDRNMAP